jgi:hypothetical protein
MNDPRIDLTQFTAASLTDPDAAAYWLTRPVEERLRALELLRRSLYGHACASALQRIFEVTTLGRS